MGNEPDVAELGVQERELLQVLRSVMDGSRLPPGAESLLARVVEAGLVRRDGDRLELTGGEIARTQSLQLRLQSDRDAAGIRAQRAEDASGRPAFSLQIEDTGQEDVALLECLLLIDRGAPLPPDCDSRLAQLARDGFIELTPQGPLLTSAGIGRCKSLQHRVQSDREARRERDGRAATVDDAG